MWSPSRLTLPRPAARLNKALAPVHDRIIALTRRPLNIRRNGRSVPSGEERLIVESPSVAAGVELEGHPQRAWVRYFGPVEFVLLLALGMAGWILCAPVLPIPADKHPRAFAIAFADMLFLVGIGWRSARGSGFVPTALRRRLVADGPAPAFGELLYAAVGAAGVSILGTRIVQAIVVKATWSAALAAQTPPAIKEAGRKAFELFKAHPAAIGLGFPIIEEIHFRLFLMTALLWLAVKSLRTPAGGLGARAWWTVIVLQGLMFGAIHAATGEGTLWWEPRTVQMLLEPRAVAGIVLGYAYWRRGLETAILAHIFADLSVLCYLMLFAHGG